MSDDTLNFAAQIDALTATDPILAIVIGSRWGDKDEPDAKCIADSHLNVPLTWDIARPLLDYTYDPGYGGTEAHPIVAWTEHVVIFSCQYDGSEWLAAVPRNPTPWIPRHHGGG